MNECPSCASLMEKNKLLKKELYSLRTTLKRNKDRLNVSRQHVAGFVNSDKTTVGTQTCDAENEEMMDTISEDDIEKNDSDDVDSFYDPVFTDSEPDVVSTPDNEDVNLEDSFNTRLDMEGKDVREEPKAIVFVAKLLLLFKFCHLCLSPSPKLFLKQNGTMLIIEATCSNCKKVFTWESQPYILSKFASGNLLLSFGILCAGASVKKMLLVFNHINLLVYRESCYYHHQKHLLIPAVWKYWQGYQANLVKSLNGKEVILAGDARHDSMGHSAKFGTYTIFCCDIDRIIYLSLVQANEAGSSSAMEFVGHKKCFEYLLHTKMVIKSFISDRHTSICKWMREDLPALCRTLKIPIINHFYDLWHIGKKISKSLKKVSKEKECELVGRWSKACVRHFYWSVTSSEELQGDVKLAKFEAFQFHILNQHTDLPNMLFNKCSHGPVQTKKVYFTRGSQAYEKLCEVLNKKHITAAVKKASPVGQTSCLEGFHSVVNQFAPKMLSFSYQGMLARNVLAALHFNHNLRREAKMDDNGESKLSVTYPKYKYGEAKVRERRIPPNFDYVEHIFECLTSTPRKDFKQIRDELEKAKPEARYKMMECEDKESAITKYKSRQNLENVIVPPTCTAAELQALTNPTQGSAKQRKAPVCKACKAPRKGHKKGPCAARQKQLNKT